MQIPSVNTKEQMEWAPMDHRMAAHIHIIALKVKME